MPRKNPQGRGFYLCPDPACVSAGRKRGRRVGFWGSVDLDLLRSLILSRKEECRRNRNDKD
jgi:hypothetical protein